jgi:DNA-directed RNA polymerase subunit RPC12/RpoP
MNLEGSEAKGLKTMKCPACGSKALVEGNPSDVPLLKRMFGIGNRGVRVYACVHCGNLQLAVEFNEHDLERYQQFEGEQPGVLERINSEPKKLEE